MTFLEMIEQLAAGIGHHQIPIKADARHVQGLVDSSALHYELVVQVVNALYAANGCKHLTDPVTSRLSFDALAPVRRRVLSSARTDVDAVRLIDELGAHLHSVFQPDTGGDPEPPRERRREPRAGAAAVVPLARFRHRRVKTWA
jgi:hypothetical protein